MSGYSVDDSCRPEPRLQINRRALGGNSSAIRRSASGSKTRGFPHSKRSRTHSRVYSERSGGFGGRLIAWICSVLLVPVSLILQITKPVRIRLRRIALKSWKKTLRVTYNGYNKITVFVRDRFVKPLIIWLIDRFLRKYKESKKKNGQDNYISSRIGRLFVVRLIIGYLEALYGTVRLLNTNPAAGDISESVSYVRKQLMYVIQNTFDVFYTLVELVQTITEIVDTVCKLVLLVSGILLFLAQLGSMIGKWLIIFNSLFYTSTTLLANLRVES